MRHGFEKSLGATGSLDEDLALEEHRYDLMVMLGPTESKLS